jgi:hypothetical protein
MSLKKKVLVVLLALGTLLGFASGFGHLCGHGRCHRTDWSSESSWPCERAAGRRAGPARSAPADL